MSTTKPSRRTYGTGTLAERTDSRGRTTYYGRWRTAEGRRVNVALGLKRRPGESDGLTKAQAEAELRRRMDAEPAPAAAVTGRSLQSVADDWVASRERAGRGAGTIEDYRSALDQHVLTFFGADTALTAITPERCAAFVTHLEGVKSTRTRRPLSAKSVRNYAGVLSTMLGWAAAAPRHWVAVNPAAGLELPAARTDDGVIEADAVLWPADIDRLVAAVAPGDYAELDRALYRLAAMSGARQSECRGLRWQDVDFDADRVRLFEALKRGGRRGRPKSGKGRSVPMAGAVRDALLELRNASRWTGADDPVFATPSTGQPMARTDLMERYRDALAAAGLPVAFRFHDLRHTFASTLAQAGVPERQIMEWCGHASASMTRKYMHFAPASAADVAAVDAAFGGRSNRRSNLSPASMPEGRSAQTATP
jgi:integrase